MSAVRFVDVFSGRPFGGNALAVVHDADGLDDERMQQIARWTNLSETTFLVAPTDPRADYRVRIWTVGSELPFAGHPTIGTAHAWLEAGGVPGPDGVVRQQCGVGLVDLRTDGMLRFAAPALLRSGPVSRSELDRTVEAMRLDRDDLVEAAWIDNGPGWMGLLLRSPEAVLRATPDPLRAAGMKVGLAGAYPAGARDDGVALEVRAFFSDGVGLMEDPVTGSLNAGLAQWLVPSGHLPARYVAAQGTVLGREGRVHVHTGADRQVWVGGAACTMVVGSLVA